MFEQQSHRDPADVVADVETGPVTADLITELDRIDPAAVDDETRLALVVAWDRVANHAHARRAESIGAIVAGMSPAPFLDEIARTAAEVGAALSLSPLAATSLTATSERLCTTLTATLAAVRAGGLSWTKAVLLADGTATLTDEQARAVEERVLRFAGARTPGRHRDAVRRWTDRIDPDGMAERRRQIQRDVVLVRTHGGDAMGTLFARMTSEQLDTVWVAADSRARAMKAAGDERTLDQLRVDALVTWATSYLSHGDPTTCDRTCDPLFDDTAGMGERAGDAPDADSPEDGGDSNDGPGGDGADGGPSGGGPDGPGGTPTGGAPTRHGRPATLAVLWSLAGLLGVEPDCGELADSGAVLPPGAMADLVGGGVTLRRLLIDPDSGELLDLTPRTWRVPGRADGRLRHGPPVELRIVLDTRLWHALTGDPTLHAATDNREAVLRAAMTAADPRLSAALEAMLAAPVTADRLDTGADDDISPALAGFVAARDRHPVNPAAGVSAAASGDIDHTVARRRGGPTARHNLASLTRRWHVLVTHGGWRYRRDDRGWVWTSPLGRTYCTAPYDYRSC